ncbi:MAG: enoyl-CoA hydratase/isomerase family protein [Solirubrobacteraceae bacterium]
MPERESTVGVRTAEAGIAVVELNRPEALNAISMRLYADLERSFAELEADPASSVLVLTGRGRAFSVGADLKERRTMSADDVRRRRELAPRVFGSMARCRKPVIAAVAGYALGGGCELALACDLIIADRDAVFGLPETTLGVIPGGGATQRLPRLVGLQRAKELILTGRRFSAVEAERFGMLARVAEPGGALDAALEVAREMAANPPMALFQAKRALQMSQGLDVERGVLFEAEAYQACLATACWDVGLENGERG